MDIFLLCSLSCVRLKKTLRIQTNNHSIDLLPLTVEILRPPIMSAQSPAPPQSSAADSVSSNQTGFNALESNVPGLGGVLLDQLNMKDYGEYRYNIRTH